MLMLFSNMRHDKKWQIRFVACPAEASSQTTAPAAAKFGAGLIKNQLKPYPAKMLVRCECSEDPTMGPHKRALAPRTIMINYFTACRSKIWFPSRTEAEKGHPERTVQNSVPIIVFIYHRRPYSRPLHSRILPGSIQGKQNVMKEGGWGENTSPTS